MINFELIGNVWSHVCPFGQNRVPKNFRALDILFTLALPGLDRGQIFSKFLKFKSLVLIDFNTIAQCSSLSMPIDLMNSVHALTESTVPSLLPFFASLVNLKHNNFMRH